MANQHNNISFAGNVVADGRVLGDNTIAFKVAQNQYDAKAAENQHTNWFQCYWYQKDPTKLVGAFRKGVRLWSPVLFVRQAQRRTASHTTTWTSG